MQPHGYVFRGWERIANVGADTGATLVRNWVLLMLMLEVQKRSGSTTPLL